MSCFSVLWADVIYGCSHPSRLALLSYFRRRLRSSLGRFCRALSATLSAPLSPLFGSPKPKPTQPTSQPSSPDRAKELFGKFGQSVGWAGRWDTPTHTECMTMGTSINPDSPLVAMPFSLSFHRGNYYARGADDGWRGLIRAEGRSVGRSDGVPREAMVGRSQVAPTGSYIVKLWMGVCYPVGIL